MQIYNDFLKLGAVQLIIFSPACKRACGDASLWVAYLSFLGLLRCVCYKVPTLAKLCAYRANKVPFSVCYLLLSLSCACNDYFLP